MPFTVANGQKVEMTIYCQLAEQVGVNVVHYGLEAVVGTPTSTDLVKQYSAAVAGEYRLWLADDATYVGAKIRLLFGPGPLPAAEYSKEGGGAGAGGVPLPRQLTGFIRKRRGIQGPTDRGRFYASFPGADMRTGLNLSAGGFDILDALREQIFGVANSVTIIPSVGTSVRLDSVLLNRQTGSVSAIARTQTGGEFATQRRRGFFGRPNVLPSELQP